MTATPPRPGTYRRGLRFLLRRRATLARLAAWSVLETGQTFLLGLALARALDDGFLAGRQDIGLLWLGVAVLGVVAGAVGTARVYSAVAGLVEPLRDLLVRRVVERGVLDGDGAAVSRLTQQVEIARDTFAGLIMVSRSFVFTAAGALIGLFSLAPVLLLVVAPPLVAGLALFLGTLRPLSRGQERFLIADESVSARLALVCAGLRDVTAAGAEEPTARDAGTLIDRQYRAARTLAWWAVPRVLALGIGGQLPLLLLLVTAPWTLDRGVSPGALVGALAYVSQSLLPALRNLVHGLGAGGSRLVVVLRRLTSETGQQDSSLSELTREAWDPSAPALEATALTFAYGPGAEPVLDGLTLTVPQGGHLAVVGPSGIGKSTLAGLAAGLLVPGAGDIRVCGLPPRCEQAAAQRVLIPQEAYVFSGTLRDNLGYLRPDPVPDGELTRAATAIGLDTLLGRLGGFDAPLDPAALSAGERQLVALTRAYLSPAPLAVLDEATCHLDPAAEERAERAFAARPGGTLVVVAHRISSAHRADRILVMDGPRTVCGRHEELLVRSSLYRDLAGEWGEPAGPRPSQPALALGDTDRVDPVAGADLAGDGGHVIAHRAVGQMQAARDLGDRSASGGERQHP
ncbi:ABC transporter ATP-binding protein/permease [Streptomyces kunmingensis]|uniref:ABC transporter ATP-binding protein/permease n=1 Tax=Streptomyces kunmingensis TaxID=68225 RepID=A0ABU6C581_9ACTN|nr:ABC transporter ATP-binding protein [Streptomyces kunmingensis]MEB3959728.1 ABC transporter ATP-binding protein/permease [Streptomyces kunmingensis]